MLIPLSIKTGEELALKPAPIIPQFGSLPEGEELDRAQTQTYNQRTFLEKVI
jgi:hypothetical protein